MKNILKKKHDPQYYFFSGKGGVGKTSCAAAAALYFANSGKKTLVVSVDPAHSLGDSFAVNIGGEVKKLDKNLFAVEIDPVKSMQEYKEKFSLHIEKMDYLKGFGLEDTFDIAGMTPGIDEIAAFDKFLKYMQSEEYDVIIFDTAPTGHALRFLLLPEVLDSWIGKLIRMRMKITAVTGIIKKILPFGEKKDGDEFGGKELEAMKKRIEMAKKILTDKQKTHFNLVLIPEAMSILESERSMKTLDKYNINVESVIVNQLVPKNSGCKFCSERRQQQTKRMEEIKNVFSGAKIRQLSQFGHEVRGFPILEKVADTLYQK
ncbi:MAG: ArsA family ATPase [Candidatus Aenigmarchaeota archaeon]|nr:ArsA family ATPase [Candidatus Aenigmarchaeota archaeon]